VLAAGIGRVIAAMEDPHGIVAGRGFRRLRRAGIEVDVGLCGSEARSLNAPFIQLVTRGMPFVTAKWASTLDGRIAAPAGGLHWITGDAARRHVHRERGLADAILVGIGTVLADDPRLTCRVPGGRNPRRIILDSRARLPLQSRLVQTVAESDVLVVTTAAAPARRVRSLERAGCRILTVPAAGGRCSLRALLRRLGQDQITHLLVEGGQAVLSGFFREGLVDRVLVYLGPKLIGAGAPPLSDLGIERMGDALELRDIRTRRFGDDLLIEGVVRREARRAKR
jgi:diaminohydroxyphosphoribosylaminopyrimidine deaminase/5-amino-6-(5-phosphoribosylamino)uracil reductase